MARDWGRRSLRRPSFAGASKFLAPAGFTQGEGWKNRSALILHQATKQLYHCVLVVLTLYSPKSHKLNFLRSQAEQIEPGLIEAWLREGKFERRAFELLRQAYVNARYSPHYKISEKELDWLIQRVSPSATWSRASVVSACDLPLQLTVNAGGPDTVFHEHAAVGSKHD